MLRWHECPTSGAVEDLLDERLELPLLPDGADAQPLEHGPRQGEAQGNLGLTRQPDRARVAIGDRLRDRFGCGRRATSLGEKSDLALVERLFALLHECLAPVPQLEATGPEPESISPQAERLLYYALVGAIGLAWSARRRMP